jgi:hypothetical protein
LQAEDEKTQPSQTKVRSHRAAVWLYPKLSSILLAAGRSL